MDTKTTIIQSYGGDNSYYSAYPIEDKPYECRTSPFEGFFVSSVEFCDNKKFDDKRDHKDRDNKTGTQGPPGSTINTTSIYTNLGPTCQIGTFAGGDKSFHHFNSNM